MPGRLEPFINNYVYHVFNKTLNSQRLFNAEYSEIFLPTVNYYRSAKARVSLSHLKRLAPSVQENLLKIIEQSEFFRVEILAFCLMPTHYHFLLKQILDNGILKFMTDLGNSFTRYYNIRNDREGPLFIPRFKSVLIKNEEQLKHVCRYIHLNPYSGEIISELAELENYRWSSYREYLSKNQESLSNPQIIMKLFGNDRLRFKKFNSDQADYQRSLEYVKYAEKWL